MRVKHAVISLVLLTSPCVAQDVNGDLNTNIGANSNVDSNNSTSSNTNSTVNNGGQGVMGNPVPTAMAPTMMGAGGNDSCLIPSSRGFQVSLFGVAEGSMTQDLECGRRKDARLLGAPQAVGGLGLQVSGISVMCSDARVFKAMALANTVCPVIDVDAGRLLVGRDAVEMYRKNPEALIVGYAVDRAFWNLIFKVGEPLDEIPSTNSSISLSDRFRRNGGANDNQPTDDSERGNGASEAVTDTGNGG